MKNIYIKYSKCPELGNIYYDGGCNKFRHSHNLFESGKKKMQHISGLISPFEDFNLLQYTRFE